MNLRRHVICHVSGESKNSYDHYTVRFPFLDPWYCFSEQQSSAPGKALYPSKPHLHHTADTTQSHRELTMKVGESQDFLKFRKTTESTESVDGLTSNPVLHSDLQFPHL